MAPSATNGIEVNGHGAMLSNDPTTDASTQDTGDRPSSLNAPTEDDVTILEQLCGTRKKLRIAVLGAGVSGLNFFKRAEERLKNVEIVCYEKNDDVGGTWYENRYPGCACDVPSVVYQFHWRHKPWSRYYSYSPEIWEYIKSIEQENDFINKYIKLRHAVNSLSWSDDIAQWTINVTDMRSQRTFEDHVDIVIDGCGVLNKWKWPNIEGLHNFKGELLHSAQWNQDTDLKGKKVALIGAGSSAVQILPNIYPSASHIYTWIRNKIWITAGFAQAFAGPQGANFIYSDEQKNLLANDPDAHLAYSKMIESELNQRFRFIINGSRAQTEARDFSENEMKTLLSDHPHLLENIMPTDFFVGCRRPTPGNGYLETLSGSKTTAYTEQLGRITERGFIDPDGNEQEVDVIICATGFDTSYKPRMPFLVNGVDMREKWKDHPSVPSYLSLGLAEVPNYFIFAGAYCPSAHGSFFPLVDGYCHYFNSVIEKMQVERIRSVRPRGDVTEKFVRHADSYLKRTAWTGPCSSWFKGGKVDGRPAIYPGSRLHFLRLIERVRWEDFEIRYDGEEGEDGTEMWGWLGNGFHVCERDGSDITWYMGKPEREVDEGWLRDVMGGDKGVVMKRPS